MYVFNQARPSACLISKDAIPLWRSFCVDAYNSVLDLAMSKRILLFEDEDDVRSSMEMILEKSGYIVKGCAEGGDVFSLISDFKPDLILLDIKLEKEDGRDICRSIRQNDETAALPVIMVSGVPELYNAISDVGANDIVLKPFDEATLIQRIERQLN